MGPALRKLDIFNENTGVYCMSHHFLIVIYFFFLFFSSLFLLVFGIFIHVAIHHSHPLILKLQLNLTAIPLQIRMIGPPSAEDVIFTN